MARTRLYRNGELAEEGFPVAEVSERLKEPDALVWLNVDMSRADEIDAIHEELGLHRLAVEDALQPHERPKFDRYSTHQFLNCCSLRLDTASGEILLGNV